MIQVCAQILLLHSRKVCACTSADYSELPESCFMLYCEDCSRLPELCSLDVLWSGRFLTSNYSNSKKDRESLLWNLEDYRDEPSTSTNPIWATTVRNMEKIAEAVTIVNKYQSEEKLEKMHCLYRKRRTVEVSEDRFKHLES